jgi:hypothetical protein
MADGEGAKPLILNRRILKPAEKRVLKKLSSQVKSLKDKIGMEIDDRNFEQSDHPESRAYLVKPKAKDKQESLRREEAMRMQLKNTNRMISKVKAGALVPKSLFKTAGSAPSLKSGLGAAVARWNELFQTN